jgi:hypothetical protein
MADEISLVGTVCECSNGRRAVVTERKRLPGGMAWVGVGLEDGSLWSSRNPKFVCPASKVDLIEAFKRQDIRIRLDGIWPYLENTVDLERLEFAPDAALVAVLEIGRQVQVRRLNGGELEN